MDTTQQVLINLSNHPKDTWQFPQLERAKELYGEVIDWAFPHIPPEADYTTVVEMAENIVSQIMATYGKYHLTIHIAGEITFTYIFVNMMKEAGISCIASTTKRMVEVDEHGTKISKFAFVSFRGYF